MKIRFLKLKSGILIATMSLLGLLSCKKEEPDHNMVMYGGPYSKYHCVPTADEVLSQETAPTNDIVIAAKDED